MSFKLKSKVGPISFDLEPVNTPKPIPEKNFCDTRVLRTIHSDDASLVSLISPDMDRGPWIAGGAVLAWYQGLPVGPDQDIDVWCSSENQAKRLIKDLTPYTCAKIETDNACTLRINDSTKTIQVITRIFPKSVEEVLNTFDISVCQIATDGRYYKLGPLTARDINNKHLRIVTPNTNSLKRVLKYWIYGYNPLPETLELLTNSAIIRWGENKSDDYE